MLKGRVSNMPTRLPVVQARIKQRLNVTTVLLLFLSNLDKTQARPRGRVSELSPGAESTHQPKRAIYARTYARGWDSDDAAQLTDR